MSRKKTDRNAPFQTIKGAAYLTGLSAGWLRAGCKAGTVPHVMIGAEYRINVPALLAQLEAASAANAKGIQS